MAPHQSNFDQSLGSQYQKNYWLIPGAGLPGSITVDTVETLYEEDGSAAA